MRTKEMILIGLFIALLLVANASALYSQDNSTISFGHPLRIQSVSVPDLAPGEMGVLKVIMKDDAAYPITDIRAKLILPAQLQFINDVNEVRVSEINAEGIQEVSYNIIALPTSAEGIYSASLLINYVSHYGVNTFNVGEENSDNYSFGIMIKSPPSLFVQIDSTDIYTEKLSGDVTLKFVNNGTSNIKFLTVNLDSSSDYEILSDSKSYVGDLDSNDYQSLVYKIKINNKNSDIKIPLEITFRDSMNNQYSQKLDANLKILDGSESGNSSDISPVVIIIVIIVILVVIYFIYSRLRKKKKN